MGWIPGWESIQATGWWSGFFFWASIVSLIGLGISEVASHRYSERRDELLEAQQETEKKRHDEEIAQLHLETAQANRDAETARREVATAQAETAKANERTAEIKLALEREIAARQPRTITPEQHAKIVEYLKSANPKGPITVVWKLFDEEAEKFARQIIAVLKDSGFDVTEGRGPFGFGERGAWIVVRDLEKVKTSPTAIGAVQGAFRDILHIQFDGGERKEGYPDVDVTIAVGAKP
jgi:hypothetical protein